MSILEVSGLRKVYTSRLGGSRVEALRNVSFTVEQGEYVAIMGESGSGFSVYTNNEATRQIQVCRNIFLTFPILQAFQPVH